MDDHFYLGIANELAAKLRRVASFTKHGPSIGSYHEEALRTVLRSFLPDRFSLKTGFVFHPDRGASSQGDVLIVDESHPNAYYLREGDFAIVSAEALVCAIEVKTRLTKKSFTEAMDTLYSFRQVGGIPNHPVTFLFAYESPPFSPQTLDAWYKAVKVPDSMSNYPWAVYVLNQGVILFRGASAGPYGHAPCQGPEARGTRIQALAIFLQVLRKVLLLHSSEPGNPFSFGKLGATTWTKRSFRFGTGLTAEKGA